MSGEEGSYGRRPDSETRSASYESSNQPDDDADDGEFTAVSKSDDGGPDEPPSELDGEWLPGIDGDFLERGVDRLQNLLPPDDADMDFGTLSVDGGFAIRERFGAETRTRVQDVDDAPYRYICYLEIVTATNKVIVGTGWLAGPRTIITAGHCVYRHNAHGWIKKVTAYFGLDGMNDSPSVKISESNNIYSVSEWKSNRDPRADIGAIVLDKKVGDTLGFFGFSNKTRQELLASRLNIVGYPSGFQQMMYQHGELPSDVDTNVIYYRIDTSKGNSGSPVIVKKGNKYTVVGIHNNGPVHGLPFNRATRINSKIITQLRKWKNM